LNAVRHGIPARRLAAPPPIGRQLFRQPRSTGYRPHVLTLRDQAGREQTLRVTDEHPFYRTAGAGGSTLPEVVMGLSGPRPTGGRGSEGWAPARLLRPGDRVLGDAGELQVEACRKASGHVQL
jgi:hypothetical protein